MNRTPLIASLVAAVLVVAALAASLASGVVPALGLDLRGGISAVYSPVVDEGQELTEDELSVVLDETIAVVRDRVDAIGVAEPEITRQGGDVLVQLPGLSDAARAQEIIGTTAKLSFRRVEGILPPDAEDAPDCGLEDLAPLPDDEPVVACGAEPATDGEAVAPTQTIYQLGPAEISGDDVENALAQVGQGGWVVQLDLASGAADTFQEITSDLACERDAGQPGQFAIVLDGRVQSAPGINASVPCGQGIAGGSASITVGAADAADEGEAEAQDLGLVLRTGSLPISLEPSTFQTVSPTLGSASLDAGLLAAGIGLALVALYLLAFYRTLGAVAIAALLVFGVLITGLLGLLGEIGFTLTLAGIAGIVVSIGITADSSILYFERIRDEVRLGKTVRTAVQRAFRSAFRTNLAGNTVTLAAALILYFLAVGAVRGFALTLGLATILDILILWGFTRPLVLLLSTTRLLTRSMLRVDAPPRRQGRGSRTRTEQEVAS